MPQPLRIAITGASGRMGQSVAMSAADQAGVRLVAAVDRADASMVGRPVLPESDITVTADLAAAVAKADVLIDFTRPEPCMAALEACQSAGCGIVIGTTGFDDAQLARIARASEEIPTVMAANFSLGVTLLRALVEKATAALGTDFDIEITEAHHRHKVDAPSGTALALGEAAAKARGEALADLAVMAREGHTGERRKGSIGFSTVRGGDVVGDHQVMFLGDGERIEIGHRASSRATFANGALRAAQWLRGRAPGRYDMFDVLDLA